MKPWLEARYYCRNTAGACIYARSDAPFSAEEFQHARGICAGNKADGCGKPLVAGTAKNHLPRWMGIAAGSTAVLLALSLAVRAVLFPAPIEQLSFSTSSSQVIDEAGIASLEVVRRGNVDRSETVSYRSFDGSARSGEDYQPTSGRLTFLKGERSKALVIAILPDRTYQKARRYFVVRLTNAAGLPQHIVQILPNVADRNQKAQAEQTVRAASLSAKDVADFHVRLRTLDALLAHSSSDSGELSQYRESLSITRGNLSRARESYLQFLRDLQSHQPNAVLQAMQAIATELQRRGYAQQSRAVDIMKRHYKELLSKQVTDMDRWAEELSSIIPRTASQNDSTTT
jgi:hypothetical protein